VLADLGCDIAQGWAVARAMPVGDFLQWLSRTRVFAFDEAATR
jgi:sensor c-di-GMP phosphodiesterase-like protein